MKGIAQVPAQFADVTRCPVPLSERYDVIQPLEDGGMASLDIVRDRHDGRLGALKRLHPRLALDPSCRELFAREAAIHCALERAGVAGVPRLLDSGSEGGLPYLVIEWIDGLELECLDGRTLSLSRAAELGARLCDIVAAVHGAGFVHRDLAPANVMLDVFDRIWLIDFGGASPIGGTCRADRMGVVYGTRPYIAPERLTQFPVRNETSADVYALGGILFELLTGTLLPRRPHHARERLAAIGLRVESAERILHALDPEPAVRPTAAELGAALAAEAGPGWAIARVA